MRERVAAILICSMLGEHWTPAQGDAQNSNSQPTNNPAPVRGVEVLTPGQRVTRVRDAYSQSQAEEFFKRADSDGNGWLSLRELRHVLQIDRREFTVYDRDADGRVDLGEFLIQFKKLIENGAGISQLPESRPESAPADATSRSAAMRTAANAETRPASGPFRLGGASSRATTRPSDRYDRK
ncbi:MAG: EF-hand domain-containing protein [Planctomycetes bacterium]|nr:EF-hand domain-containing protein [Planctomycetota bacterium]